MTDERFRRSFKWSTIIHMGIVVLLLLVPLILNWREHRKKKHEIITYIDLTAGLPEPAAPQAPAVAPPPPEPKQDIPEPVKPKKKKKIKVNKKRIKRQDRPPDKTKPELSEEEIRKLLDTGKRHHAGGGTRPVDLPGWYYALIRQKLYDAWEQPGGLSVPPGTIVRVSIRIEKNGRISQRDLVRGSGFKILDDSVMRGVRSVSSVKALPATYAGKYKDIVIDFELTR